MRYTTIIDISTSRDLYKNINVRLIYLHMVLKAGYHDHDRDLVRYSIRNLAADAGLTISATRHALAMLMKFRMIARQGDMWIVRKFVTEQPITTRAKSAREQKKIDQELALKRAREERQRAMELEQLEREKMLAEGKTSWQLYYERQQEKAAAGDAAAQTWIEKNKETIKKYIKQ